MAAPALVVSRWSAPHRSPAPPAEADGPFYQSVLSPFGERFSSDERNHRIVVEQALGPVSVGGYGDGAGEFSCPRGLALLPAHTREATRLFVCDAMNHRIQVFDGYGNFVIAFGGRGMGPGQFIEPSSVTVVRPFLPGDDEIPAADREPLLAVTDALGRRTQLVTLDGVFFTNETEASADRAQFAPSQPVERVTGRRGLRLVAGGRSR